jgi:hypothetical protein
VQNIAKSSRKYTEHQSAKHSEEQREIHGAPAGKTPRREAGRTGQTVTIAKSQLNSYRKKYVFIYLQALILIL